MAPRPQLLIQCTGVQRCQGQGGSGQSWSWPCEQAKCWVLMLWLCLTALTAQM